MRVAGPADAARLALVARATFLETFAGILEGADIVAHCERQHDPGTYGRLLSQEDARLWLAETGEGGAPVGYAVLAPSSVPLSDLSPDDIELKRIYLLQRFHGQGLGQMLLKAAVEEARARGAARLLLGVYKHNERARAFYRRNRFHEVGDRQFEVGKNRYEDTMFALDLRQAQS